jgi:hypothetical protein
MSSLRAAFVIAIVVSGFSIAGITHLSLAQNSTPFEISGYILDSNGHGIAGAYITFNDVSTPSVSTDYSGYYMVPASADTYHVNVWPPFDSNYINYDEPGFIVGSDITKNITLTSGYKVSGYITDSSGAPVIGAAVLFRDSANVFGSGWFSNSEGYYFLSVPAGTYTINAHPRAGNYYSGPTTDFPPYYEYNFTVNYDTVKNITVGGSTPTSNQNTEAKSNVNSEPTTSTKPVSEPSPKPWVEPSSTSPANITPTQLTISTKAETLSLLEIVLGIIIIATPIAIVISAFLQFYLKKRRKR